MWDNNTPLQLLNTMPKVLEKEHLEKLQMLFDADKYKNQLVSGSDLCGTYAPFCYDCDKGTQYPCAIAYVNFMKAQGADIEIAAGVFGEKTENSAEEQSSLIEEESSPKEKTKIRIAIARKKTLL